MKTHYLGYYSFVLAESYLHNLDPFVFQITDSIGLRWYGLAYIGGFIIALLLLRYLSRKKFSPVPEHQMSEIVFSCVIGVILGGRIGYALFYDPTLFFTVSDSFPWWELLAINRGGMSSHGGMLGVLGTFIYCGRKYNISIPHLMDIGTYVAIPGLFLGRIANLINAELWGTRLPEALQQNPPWWSIKYPTEITEVWTRQPVRYTTKLESLQPLQTKVHGGESFYSNIVNEAYQGNQVVIDTIQPLLTAWYPSQLFQAITNGPLLFALLTIVWWKPRKPGVVAGWFLIIYGFFRTATEALRQPDDGVSLVFDLTRGQLLSIAMMVAGTLIIYLFSQRRVEKFGGLEKLFINK